MAATRGGKPSEVERCVRESPPPTGAELEYTMELTINGEKRTIERIDTLEALMQLLGYSLDTPGIAVAVNDTVVPKSAWTSTRIAPGNTIDIIHAVQGG